MSFENDSCSEQIRLLEACQQDVTDISPQAILERIFGHNGFKPRQKEVIDHILRGKGHALAVMPTGGGKSLCFQLPALKQKNTTIIVSPLIALMKDQIDGLVQKKIYSAFFLNSSISEENKKKILRLVEKGYVKLLYIAPESLNSDKILDVLSKVHIDLFVVDEAHCISVWGHDFRPDYLKLSDIVKRLNNPPVLALTATASSKVKKDIQKQLGIKCKVFIASFDRPNLYIHSSDLEPGTDKEQYLVALVRKLSGPTIIFVSYTKTSQKLASILKKNGIKATFYHGHLEPEEKEKRQNQFMKGEENVMVCTIAFGMGVDKPDIRNIIHFNVSQSIENYYQEIGRAGRDGNLSNCITMLSAHDVRKIKDLITSDWPDAQKITNILHWLTSQNKKYIFTTPRRIEIQCEVKEIPVKVILHRLEEAGAIKRYPKVIGEVKLRLNGTPEQIIQKVPKYKTELEIIFSTDCFKSERRTWFVLEQLMDETRLDYFRIKEIFETLRRQNLFQWTDERRMDVIWVQDTIKDFNITPLVQMFEAHRDEKLHKVDALVASLQNNGCIRKAILKYFDEDTLTTNCGMCSHCVTNTILEGVKPIIDDNYALDEDIEAAEDQLEEDKEDAIDVSMLKIIGLYIIEAKDLVKLLQGKLHPSASKMKKRLPCYGIHKDVDEGMLNNTFQDLVKQKLVKEDTDGKLRITKSGLAFLKYDTTISE